MLIDARSLPDGSLIEADLCIVGGGMAGLAIARELMDGGATVAILEGGGDAPTPESQRLYQGTARLLGPGGASRQVDEYPVTSRARWLGGSGTPGGPSAACSTRPTSRRARGSRTAAGPSAART